ATNLELHTPVAFLSRFEKYFLDPNLLEQFSLDPLWKEKFEKLQKTITIRFRDRLQLKKILLFVGFVETYTYVMTVLKEKKESDDNNEKTEQIEQTVQKCLSLLLQNTALQHFIDDKGRERRAFIPYADILDILKREGADKANPYVLAKVVTHDYPMGSNFVMKTKDEVYVITRDDLAQSGYVSKTSEELSNVYDIDGKYGKQTSKNNQMTE
ncbi:hypothetical protein RFI_25330, partial [Reticulomyxa filosa]